MSAVLKTINQVNDKQSFLVFVQLLINNFKENPNEWENNTIDSYLEALANWTEDMEGYYENNDLPIPSNINWNVFAHILMAARMYE